MSWRNNTIGHGLMCSPKDDGFFQDSLDKINKLIDFFNNHPIPKEINNIDYNNMQPFIFEESGHVFIFESVSHNGELYFLDQISRRRRIRKNDYFTEKRKKYNSQLNITETNRIWNQRTYLSSVDDAMNGYYLSNYYKKPAYMKDWLEACVDNFEKGVFLLQGARRTGKSSFALACDELNQHGTQKIKIRSEGDRMSVRSYYCSRMGFSNQNDFISYLCDIFRKLPNGEQILVRDGSLPSPKKSLSEFLLQEAVFFLFGQTKVASNYRWD